MDKQNQVLQMAKDICRVQHNCNDVCKPISACDALKYAERAVEAGYSKQSEWISVDERLPERNGRYLTHCNIEGQSLICILHYCKVGGFNEALVTHWMPLLEAPKGGAE